jgi:hypothetical protein
VVKHRHPIPGVEVACKKLMPPVLCVGVKLHCTTKLGFKKRGPLQNQKYEEKKKEKIKKNLPPPSFAIHIAVGKTTCGHTHTPWSSDSRHPLKRTFPVMFDKPSIPSLMFTIARGPLKHTCLGTLTSEPTIHSEVQFI